MSTFLFIFFSLMIKHVLCTDIIYCERIDNGVCDTVINIKEIIRIHNNTDVSDNNIRHNKLSNCSRLIEAFVLFAKYDPFVVTNVGIVNLMNIYPECINLAIKTVHFFFKINIIDNISNNTDFILENKYFKNSFDFLVTKKIEMNKTVLNNTSIPIFKSGTLFYRYLSVLLIEFNSASSCSIEK